MKPEFETWKADLIEKIKSEVKPKKLAGKEWDEYFDGQESVLSKVLKVIEEFSEKSF